MGILGFSFSKISSEKKPRKDQSEKITVKHEFDVTKITLNPLMAGNKETDISSATVNFSCKWTYGPSLGNITIEGGFILEPNDKNKKLFEDWKKTKKVPKDRAEEIFQIIISRTVLQAILIAKEIGLPPPIQLPKLDVKKN